MSIQESVDNLRNQMIADIRNGNYGDDLAEFFQEKYYDDLNSLAQEIIEYDEPLFGLSEEQEQNCFPLLDYNFLTINDEALALEIISSVEDHYNHVNINTDLFLEREFTLKAVRIHGLFLRWANQFQNDQEVVEAALSNNPNAIWYVDQDWHRYDYYTKNLLKKYGNQNDFYPIKK